MIGSCLEKRRHYAGRALKHLACAAVIAQEVLKGHNDFEHRFHLEGHLAEAENETAAIDPESAAMIRQLRCAAFNTVGGFSFPAKRLSTIMKIAAWIEMLERRWLASQAPEKSVSGVVDGRVPDVLVPLSAEGTKHDFDELRFALRSIWKNLTHYGKVRIVCDRPPEEYFTNIAWTIHKNDMGRKQMNIHFSLLDAMKQPGVAERLIFWADDNVLLKNADARALPLVGRTDDLTGFLRKDQSRFWYRTLAETAQMLQKRKLPILNFEAHTPIELEREKYLRIAKEYNYTEGIGPCYLSLYANTLKLQPTCRMRDVKVTFEGDKVPVSVLPDKMFLGYDDGGINAGVLKKLLERFPDPSPFEKFPEEQLYGGTVSACVVVGTCQGSAEFLDLQLAAFRKFHAAPVLVVADGAAAEEAMTRVAKKYAGVEFVTLGKKYGHTAGDLAIYAAGLRWAQARGFDLMVKLSRRFIPLKAWLPGLLERAKATDAPAFTSYTTSFGCEFRTECCALSVKAWRDAVPEMEKSAVPGKKFSVEKWMQQQSIKVAHRHLSPRFWRTRIAEGNPPARYGYALWTDLLGTDRKAPPAGVLWHDVHTKEDYAAAAAQLGL